MPRKNRHKLLISPPPPPIGPIGGGGLTFWILVADSDPNIMKIFLVNILGISNSRCDFFGVFLFSSRKKGGVKKTKVPQNYVFLSFFFQKMNIF